MSKLHYVIEINAPKEKVWDAMLSDQTYREWTGAFHEGSYYEGGWDKGSSIRFLAPDDGKASGLFSKIVENVPYKYISIEHIGEVIDGKENTTSEDAQQWSGTHENYMFSETDGVTTVAVELDGEGVSEEIKEMFDDMWPPALQKLKEICERA